MTEAAAPAGASGFVQLARDKHTGAQVAIKFVPRGSPYLHRAAEREILNHRLLEGHRHIVQFHEVGGATASPRLRPGYGDSLPPTPHRRLPGAQSCNEWSSPLGARPVLDESACSRVPT